MAASALFRDQSFTIRSQGAAIFGQKIADFFIRQRQSQNHNLCDVEIVVDGKKEYVHSAVLAVHSQLVNKILNNNKLPPFSWTMNGFRFESLRTVIDWMYYGQATSSPRFLGDDLAVAAYLEIEEIHRELEKELVFVSSNGYPEIGLNCILNQHSKVTGSTVQSVWEYTLRSPSLQVALLSPAAVGALVSIDVPLPVKANLLNTAIKWIYHTGYPLEKILSQIAIREMSAIELHQFLDTLRSALAQTTKVSVSQDKVGRLVVTYGINQQNDGPYVEMPDNNEAPPTIREASEIMLYSELESLQHELQKLPNPFAKSSSYNKTNKGGTGVDMEIFLSDTYPSCRVSRVDPKEENPIRRRPSVEDQLRLQRIASRIDDFIAIPDQFEKSNKSAKSPARYGPGYNFAAPVSMQNAAGHDGTVSNKESNYPNNFYEQRGPVLKNSSYARD